MSSSLYRRSPRYQIKDDADITVTILRKDGCSQPLYAELLDLSVGGAKFKTIEEVEARQSVLVKIEAAASDESIEVDGEVRWSTGSNEDGWHIGCAFQPVIPEGAFQNLALSGVLDRRLHERNPVSLTATAKWELQTQGIPVRIVDFSAQGGFCLFATSPGKPGGRVELLLHQGEQEVVVRGEQRWECLSEDGYQIGCEFMSGNDAIRFSGFLTSYLVASPSEIPFTQWLQRTTRSQSFAAMAPIFKRRRIRRQFISTLGVGAVLFVGTLVYSHHFTPSYDETVVSSMPLPSAPPTERLAEVQTDDSEASSRRSDFGIESSLTPTNREVVVSPDLPSIPTTPSKALDEEMTVTLDSRESEPTGDGSPFEFPSSNESIAEPVQSQEFVSTTTEDQSDQQALKAFRSGCSHYQIGEFHQAQVLLAAAVRESPREPEYLYILALTQFQLQQKEQAEESVTRAVALERDQAIKDWGRKMEGYQGPARIWLETARRQAQARLAN